MSCFNPGGQPPNPPRVWSRVQNSCSTDNNITTPPAVVEETRMLEKGNVLQYKKNSSDITKKQRYSQIAKGKWVNRHPTLATQGYTYTDPNSRKLKRVNYRTIYLDDGTEANEPVTCPKPPIIPIPSKLPPRVGTRPGPPIPPPQPVNPNVGPNSDLNPYYPHLCPQFVDPADYLGRGPNLEVSDKVPTKRINKWPAMVIPYVDPAPPVKPRDVIADGGSLVCGPDDICPTQRSNDRVFIQSSYCNDTSDSNVPGKIETLCYNSRKYATYYPRQRRVMTNSGNKFPTGYKFSSN